MQFVYPGFLFGLLAIAIPVAIHLFEWRKPQRLLFTNVSFIKEVKLISAKQRKIKHLLVLLARVGFIISSVLAFCQPYFPAQQKSPSKGRVSVLVDTSPSMQAASAYNHQSLLDQALVEARRLPDAYTNAAQYRLIGEAGNSLSASAYRAALDRLTISEQSGGLTASFNKLNRAHENEGQYFIVSDFQKNDFTAQSLRDIDSTKQAFLVPVQASESSNVYIDSIALDDAFVRLRNDISLKIWVRNGGSVAKKDCQVKLFVGKQQAAVYSTYVEAGQTAVTTVRVRLISPELQQCRIEVEDFPVTFDNTYYFTLKPSPHIQVVALTGSDDVALRQLYGNEPLFSYASSQSSAPDYRMLAKANLIILKSIPLINTALRESIRQAVQRGSSVVVIPSAGIQSQDSYNQLFKDLGVGAVQWEKGASKPDLRELSVPSAQNPFFKEVFAAQNRQPVMPRASPILRWSRSGIDVLQMRDGEGFLSGFATGRGMVYVFAAPFSAEYTDFTSHALFVPVMYRLAMLSYHSDQQPAYRLNQRTIALSLNDVAPEKSEEVFKLSKDSLTFIPAQRRQAGTVRFDVPSGMQQPGFYVLTRDGHALTTLAFNVDKRESNLAQYSAEELRHIIGPNRKNVQVLSPAKGNSAAAQYRAERVGTPLWRYCLWIALAFLLIEVVLLRLKTRSVAAELAAA